MNAAEETQGFQSRVKKVLRNWKVLFLLALAVSVLLIGLWAAFEATIGISFLILGIALLTFSADKAVEHSVSVATALRMPPLWIGLIIVSLGTDFPEIATSIVSSALGHGDIVIGDSFGSVLAQMTLILGLVAFFGGAFKVDREEIGVLGACEVLALIASIAMVEKGYLTRLNAVFLVVSWPLFMLIARKVVKKSVSSLPAGKGVSFHLLAAGIGFLGVAVGSFVVIESVIILSAVLSVPEYFISFFIVAIGTSLPEFAVDLTAVRKKRYEIAIGDAIGSSIIDAGFSMGIGPSICGEITVSGRLGEITGLYSLLSSVIVILTLALRKKLDKKAGALFLAMYFFSYATLYA